MIKADEQKVMDKTVELWNEYLKLHPMHKDHINDVRFHIHAIQAIVLSRGYFREGKQIEP